MARAKKDGVYINYYIQKDIKDRLDRYCEDVGQTNTMAIERILKQFLDEYEETQNTNLVPLEISVDEKWQFYIQMKL